MRKICANLGKEPSEEMGHVYLFSLTLLGTDVALFQTVEEAAEQGVAMPRASTNQIRS